MLVTDAPFSHASLDDYASLVGAEPIEEIRRLARPLAGARVLHVNATAVGGGVAEMLEWRPADFDLYWSAVERNARVMEHELEAWDFIVVHDPQPLVLASLLRGSRRADTRWLWRCHIDLTAPSRDTWDVLSPHLAQYDQLVFSSETYVPAGLEAERIEVALPCIDPFRAKNRRIGAWEQAEVLDRYGIDGDRPYLLQVSRFDPWKDPLGVLNVYRRVREERPGIQLVYMAAMAADDPEGWSLYQETREAAGDDPDVHLLALEVPPWQVNRNALEVNAMQRGAAVVLQKSLREGFGLVVTESLWKEKAVVAGNVGGIRLQIRDGWNGYLVETMEGAADRVLDLLDDEGTRTIFGRRGRDVVATYFLFNRLLGQYLTWFNRLR
jgi:trehalose synthase